jgi:hypothetical protein
VKTLRLEERILNVLAALAENFQNVCRWTFVHLMYHVLSIPFHFSLSLSARGHAWLVSFGSLRLVGYCFFVGEHAKTDNQTSAGARAHRQRPSPANGALREGKLFLSLGERVLESWRLVRYSMFLQQKKVMVLLS